MLFVGYEQSIFALNQTDSIIQNKIFKKYPTKIIPDAIIAMNVTIKGSLSTFFKIISSGSEIPITDIMNASAVPSGTPFSIKAYATGTAPGEQV